MDLSLNFLDLPLLEFLSLLFASDSHISAVASSFTVSAEETPEQMITRKSAVINSL